MMPSNGGDGPAPRVGVTMADIASTLGVSAASVSNALNHPQRVSDTLRRRVLAEAARSGYAGPAAARRRLPGGRSRTVGVAFTSDLPTALGDAAALEFLQGLAAACESAHLNVMLLCAVDESPGRMAAAVSSAVVDGFIVYSVRDRDPLITGLLERHLPTVVVDAPRGIDQAAWVGSDDHRATHALGAHLRDLGHRDVGIIAPQLGDGKQNGPATVRRWTDGDFALMRSRIDGLVAGLGVTADAVPVEERVDGSRAAGAEGLHALLDRHPGLTAVSCLTDELALGALGAALRRGLHVPGDLTVTGFDDIPAARAAGLTTVAQAHRDKGRLAGELLVELAAGGVCRRRLLPTHVEVRDSSGPPRPAGN